MSLAKLQDTKSIHRNHLHSYILTMKDQKDKLRNQSHSPLQQKNEISRHKHRHQRANTLKPYSQKISQSNHIRTTALSNSMKLSHACGATQDGRVMVERFDGMWSTGEGNGKPLQYSCLENPMNSMKRQNDRILKEKLPRLVRAQYVTGDQWKNNFRKNEGMGAKQKQYPAVDVTGDRSKVGCCKEQYFIGT